MRLTSLYCAECLCGRYFESEKTEYTCPACGRIIVFRSDENPATDMPSACQPEAETA